MKGIILLLFLSLNLFIYGEETKENSFKPQVKEVNQQLLDKTKEEVPLVINTLQNIVTMESFSNDNEGLLKLGNYLKKQLEELDGKVTLETPLNNGKGKNVLGKFKGNGSKKILLMAHMDTVYPKGTLKNAPWKIDGDRIYGPGVGDAKSGIVVILHTLNLFKKMDFKNYDTITVIFNTDEEIGSAGSKDLIAAEAAKSDMILSYEPTFAGQEVLIMGTSGTGKVKVEIKGLSAHAGADPDSGINTIIEGANLVARTKDLDEGKDKLRFNWTVFESGSEKIVNVIPENAVLYADVRYPNEEKLNEVLKKLEERANQKKLIGSEISVGFFPNRPPFTTNEKGIILVQNAVNIYHSLGKNLGLLPSTGGGTDAGHATASGKPILEGMGLAGENAHTPGKEWISIESIPRRLYLSTQTIIDVCENKILD